MSKVIYKVARGRGRGGGGGGGTGLFAVRTYPILSAPLLHVVEYPSSNAL